MEYSVRILESLDKWGRIVSLAPETGIVAEIGPGFVLL